MVVRRGTLLSNRRRWWCNRVRRRPRLGQHPNRCAFRLRRWAAKVEMVAVAVVAAEEGEPETEWASLRGSAAQTEHIGGHPRPIARTNNITTITANTTINNTCGTYRMGSSVVRRSHRIQPRLRP
jgi:hypothetical protein